MIGQPGQPVEGRTELGCNLIQCRRECVQRLVERGGVGGGDVGRQVVDGLVE